MLVSHVGNNLFLNTEQRNEKYQETPVLAINIPSLMERNLNVGNVGNVGNGVGFYA